MTEKIYTVLKRINKHQIQVTDSLNRVLLLADDVHIRGDRIKVVNGIVTGKVPKKKISTIRV